MQGRGIGDSGDMAAHVPGAVDDGQDGHILTRRSIKNPVVIRDNLPHALLRILRHDASRFGEFSKAADHLPEPEGEGLSVGFGIAGYVLDDFLKIVPGANGPDYSTHSASSSITSLCGTVRPSSRSVSPARIF